MPPTSNPYRTFLGNQNVLNVIAQTPLRLQELAPVLAGAKAGHSYAPGKWTAREILCHLADCEISFGFRLRQAAAETNHVIQPFDQDAWAAPYAHLDALLALQTFCSLRNWNQAFLHALPEAIMEKPLSHPERGPMEFRTIVETMGGHDLNHLSQLETIAREP